MAGRCLKTFLKRGIIYMITRATLTHNSPSPSKALPLSGAHLPPKAMVIRGLMGSGLWKVNERFQFKTQQAPNGGPLLEYFLTPAACLLQGRYQLAPPWVTEICWRGCYFININLSVKYECSVVAITKLNTVSAKSTVCKCLDPEGELMDYLYRTRRCTISFPSRDIPKSYYCSMSPRNRHFPLYQHFLSVGKKMGEWRGNLNTERLRKARYPRWGRGMGDGRDSSMNGGEKDVHFCVSVSQMHLQMVLLTFNTHLEEKPGLKT